MSKSLARFIFLSLAGVLVVAGLSSPTFAQASTFAPNGIAYVGDAATYPAGASFNLSVQILYEGGPLKSEGVRVYFLANDTSNIPTDVGAFVLTDANGVATMNFTASHSGNVNITAHAMTPYSTVSVMKTLNITEGAATAQPEASPSPSTTASPTAIASPTATASPTNVASPTASPAPTITPTAAPTTKPTVTAVPSGTPSPGETNTQATGIIVAGVAIAVVLLVLIIIARSLIKK